MNSKKTGLLLFILVALVQLFVPAKMIYDRENILKHGTEFRLKTAPIDPNDPFRGKYISLQYDESLVQVQTEEEWEPGETVFVILATDNDGFAEIQSVSKEKPVNHQDYLKTKVNYFFPDGSNALRINYPFDRFYMEESKAYDAELAYRESQSDTTLSAYALVRIKNGKAVLKDVLIDGVPIREVAKARQQQD